MAEGLGKLSALLKRLGPLRQQERIGMADETLTLNPTSRDAALIYILAEARTANSLLALILGHIGNKSFQEVDATLIGMRLEELKHVFSILSKTPGFDADRWRKALGSNGGPT